MEETRHPREILSLSLLLGGQVAYWLSTIVVAASRERALSDGFEWMETFFATPALLLLTGPAVVLTAWSRHLNAAWTFAIAGLVCVPFGLWFSLVGRAMAIAP